MRNWLANTSLSLVRSCSLVQRCKYSAGMFSVTVLFGLVCVTVLEEKKRFSLYMICDGTTSGTLHVGEGGKGGIRGGYAGVG